MKAELRETPWKHGATTKSTNERAEFVQISMCFMSLHHYLNDFQNVTVLGINSRYRDCLFHLAPCPNVVEPTDGLGGKLFD